MSAVSRVRLFMASSFSACLPRLLAPVLLILLALAASCAEEQPVEPVTNPPFNHGIHFDDTTTHDYVWEVHEVAPPNLGNGMIAVAAIDRDNIHIAAEMTPDDTVIVVNGTHTSKSTNAVHWDGSRFRYYRLGTKSVSPGWAFGQFMDVFPHEGQGMYSNGYGFTGFLPSGLLHLPFENRQSLNAYYGTCFQGSSGRIICWSARFGAGFVEDLSKPRFQEIVGIEPPAYFRDFEEIGRDDYLYLVSNFYSRSVIRRVGGMAVPKYNFYGPDSLFRRAEALHTCDTLLYIVSAKYLYIESSRNPNNFASMPLTPLYRPGERMGSIFIVEGDAPNNVFFGGGYGNLLHFNGRSVVKLRTLGPLQLDELYIRDISIFDKGIAVVCQERFSIGRQYLVIGKARE